jgi:redox-sensitive bicupin YhaK (pirin superfamily)
MLDHFKVSPDAGFPDHPHRGQETITYMIDGFFDHEDFTGSRGTLGPGDLQFMTAGRGIVHAEIPAPNNSVEGLQLWVDLPLELKECEPRYRDLRAKEIPVVEPNEKVKIKVISGRSNGIDSVKDLAYTPMWFFDVSMKPGGHLQQEIPTDFNVFLYIMKGSVTIEGKKISQYQNVFFDTKGDGLEISVPEDAEGEAQFAIIGGKILNQPIVQHGPFVETSRERIYKAFMDYQSYSNGFERADGWSSEISKRGGKF